MSETGDPHDNETGSISGLYQQWRGGDRAGFEQLITRFRSRLLALANSALGRKYHCSPEAEDALQSAMISFWESPNRAGLGDAPDRDDLWNVLGTMTVRKVLRHQERERAQKRGGGKVVTGLPLDAMARTSQDDSLETHFEELLNLLDEELRQFAILRLIGHRNQEIAAELDCSERKVERKLQLVRAVWQEEMDRWTS